MKRDNKWFYIAVAVIYISMASAIAFGIYITRSALPLWAFLLISTLKSRGNKEDEEDDNNDNSSYWS